MAARITTFFFMTAIMLMRGASMAARITTFFFMTAIMLMRGAAGTRTTRKRIHTAETIHN